MENDDDPQGTRRLAWNRQGRRWRPQHGFRDSVPDPYSFKTRFETEPGTNPEELIAAAHAGCFTMQLAFLIQRAGLTPDELSTEAAVSLVPDGQGFKIDRSDLTLRAKVPGLDQARFEELARSAEQNCPVSRLMNAEISLDATLLD